MYGQYNIVHASFSGQSGPTNTLEKRYVFWILSSMNIDMKRLCIFVDPSSLFYNTSPSSSSCCSTRLAQVTVEGPLRMRCDTGPAGQRQEGVSQTRCSGQRVDPLEPCVLMNKIWTKFFCGFALKGNTNFKASKQMLMFCSHCGTAGKCDW